MAARRHAAPCSPPPVSCGAARLLLLAAAAVGTAQPAAGSPEEASAAARDAGGPAAAAAGAAGVATAAADVAAVEAVEAAAAADMPNSSLTAPASADSGRLELAGCAAGVSVLLPSLPRPVDWTPHDVSVWVNETLTYPEYSAAFLSAQVDGPTLFYLNESDLAAIGVQHPVHRKKFLVHIDLLRGRCMCTRSHEANFWEFAQLNPYKALVLGGAVEFAPRFALGWLLVRDSPALEHLLGYVGGEGDDDAEAMGWATWAAVAVLSLLAPNAVIALIALRYIQSDTFISVVLCGTHMVGQCTDVMVFRDAWRGLVELNFQVTNWANFAWHVDEARREWIKSTVYVLPVAVIGMVIPWTLQWMLMCAYLNLNLIVIATAVAQGASGLKDWWQARRGAAEAPAPEAKPHDD
eukprot:TRINITY_DN71155_c0_g1_i1.p1 TRINITY_DN71155_c0_g1~~TRINITY_DN71155_c0_g1_i1.p1  ORF type:complete len:435 (+),score=119.19 TRINITY_DN71155_c0_g1_i1:82-1305(+)